MPDSDPVTQQAPAAPAPHEPSEPAAPAEPAERPGFPWIRVLAGAMLVAVAVAAILWVRRPEDLELLARFEPAGPSAGERAKLWLKVSPGPALAGAELQKVRAEVRAPADLVFDRDVDELLPGEQEMVLEFAVKPRLQPGPRRLLVVITAKLPPGGGRSIEQTVGLRRELEVTVR